MRTLIKYLCTFLLTLCTVSATAATVSEAELFSWAEATYSNYFSGTPVSAQFPPYDLRYYPGTQTFLAVDTSRNVYVYGPVSGNKLLNVGTIDTFAPSITSWESAQATQSQFSVPISVTGTTANVGNVQICVDIAGSQSCGPNGGYAVGASTTISVTAASGSSYAVIVPANQPAASFCTVTSGASGVFGSSVPQAVVTCN